MQRSVLLWSECCHKKLVGESNFELSLEILIYMIDIFYILVISGIVCPNLKWLTNYIVDIVKLK